ncbi:MAG TPA: DUF4412 domain-containing protein [Pyrinomonadaceae bacterium]|nr:DUF4412 domain-containing protein [Pyrinomonadaceae bacterium]
MKNGLYTLAIVIAGAILSTTALADVKIKAKQTMSGQSYENTTYIKGKRQRTETMSGMMINLTQCDLRRGVQMNPNTKTYMINPFNDGTAAAQTNATANLEKSGVVVAGGKITTTVTIKDTGERKQMFGFPARHLIITMETASSPDACNKTNSKMQMDGWYIDAEFVLDCDWGVQSYRNPSKAGGGCQDKYEMKTIGTGKRGYPVYEKMTMFDESGKETYSMVSEVVELSKATLEAALFDVPADYREVQDASQMYATAATSSMSSSSMNSSASSSNSGLAQSVRGVASQSVSPAADAPVAAAKKEGVIRVGLATVKTGAVGESISAADLAAAVQSTLVSYLKVPNIEVVALEARLTSAVVAEAKQKECDYVINITASHKKGGGGGFGGMFGQTLGSVVGATGIGHTGSTVGNIAGQMATTAIVSATSVSGSVKSKDEISLDLKLNKIDGTSALAKIYKAKAKSNGDDIISQVIEQAAEEIVATLSR